MKVFLDSSVLLAASGSSRGASRFLLLNAAAQRWSLVSSPYCVTEVVRNLGKLGAEAVEAWERMVQPNFGLVSDTWTLDLPVSIPDKDRPVLLSALAQQCDTLLTLDRADFGSFFNTGIHGMAVMTPGDFLKSRAATNGHGK